ncbi:unnamed protein product [Onchocerca flexuosa]|uniref:CPG4 domain-containing protein n=1 Tax=Onchocerca flexuosa TaxID=387005 RepID=A0A183GZH6_9BILA|nr:unnamed protein product [Onchocerca flexuosa]
MIIGEGKAGFNETAVLTGDMIRICSCDEQHICMNEIKNQAVHCITPCLSKLEQIIDKMDDLKACFEKKQQILAKFLICFENNINSCVDTVNGTHIPKTNISELFRIMGQSLTKQAHNMANIITSSLGTIINTTNEFGVCVNDCFLNKNDNGFCYDRANCQPIVVASKARRTLRRCSNAMKWRKELGELCQCIVDAGIPTVCSNKPKRKDIGALITENKT